MTPPLRLAGEPSPIIAGTHDDDGMPAAIAFDPAVAGSIEPIAGPLQPLDNIEVGATAPAWLPAAARLIRPLSVGALMAIPTVGAASVGFVAMIDERRGIAMARASIVFLSGLPGDIVLLIGTLATGYGFARTVEKLKRG